MGVEAVPLEQRERRISPSIRPFASIWASKAAALTYSVYLEMAPLMSVTATRNTALHSSRKTSNDSSRSCHCMGIARTSSVAACICTVTSGLMRLWQPTIQPVSCADAPEAGVVGVDAWMCITASHSIGGGFLRGRPTPSRALPSWQWAKKGRPPWASARARLNHRNAPGARPPAHASRETPTCLPLARSCTVSVNVLYDNWSKASSACARVMFIHSCIFPTYVPAKSGPSTGCAVAN